MTTTWSIRCITAVWRLHCHKDAAWILWNLRACCHIVPVHKLLYWPLFVWLIWVFSVMYNLLLLLLKYTLKFVHINNDKMNDDFCASTAEKTRNVVAYSEVDKNKMNPDLIIYTYTLVMWHTKRLALSNPSTLNKSYWNLALYLEHKKVFSYF